MPLLLTTAWSPGDKDSGQSYTRAKISTITIDPANKKIDIKWGYGYLDGSSNWVWGFEFNAFTIENIAPATEYDDIFAKVTNNAEVVGDSISRIIYEWMNDKSIALGTVV